MPSLRKEKRLELLRDLGQMGSQGRADREDTENLKITFLPVREHLRMLDRADRGDDVASDVDLRLLGVRRPQHQHGGGDARIAQLHALVGDGHA